MSDGQSLRISTLGDLVSLMLSLPISTSASHPGRNIVQRNINCNPTEP